MVGLIRGRSVPPLSNRSRIEIRAEVPKDNLLEISQASVESFVTDAVDAYVTIRIDGRSPFTSPQGVERPVYVVVLEFLLDCVEALTRLKARETREERVFLTGTLYAFHLSMSGTDVVFEIYEHDRRVSRPITSTQLPLDGLVAECCAAAKSILETILEANPRLKAHETLVNIAKLAAALGQ